MDDFVDDTGASGLLGARTILLMILEVVIAGSEDDFVKTTVFDVVSYGVHI